MSKSSKVTFLLLAIIIALLSVLSIACDDSTIDDLPRVGDALKIAEAIEAASCQSQGGTWSQKYNRCNK